MPSKKKLFASLGLLVSLLTIGIFIISFLVQDQLKSYLSNEILISDIF